MIVIEGILLLSILLLSYFWVRNPEENSYGAWIALLTAAISLTEYSRRHRKAESQLAPDVSKRLAELARHLEELTPPQHKAVLSRPPASTETRTVGESLVVRIVPLRREIENQVIELARLQGLEAGSAPPADLAAQLAIPELFRKAIADFFDAAYKLQNQPEPLLGWTLKHGALVRDILKEHLGPNQPTRT